MTPANVNSTNFGLLRQMPDQPFDFIYIAPPQYKGLWLEALRAVSENRRWLQPEGQIVVQIDPTEYQVVSLDGLLLDDERRYGNTLLLFFRFDCREESRG